MTENTLPIAGSNSLADLAARINEAHGLARGHARAAVDHAQSALEHAIACGKMLVEARDKMEHGQWLPWLKANVAFGVRTAQGYMRVARHLPNTRNVAHLPLRQVLKELQRPMGPNWREFSAEVTEIAPDRG